MNKLTSYLLLLASCFLLSSCGAEQEYSSWSCRFIFNNGTYLDQTLGAAINPTITGIFCKVTEQSRGGTRYLIFENNQGASSQHQMMAEMIFCQLISELKVLSVNTFINIMKVKTARLLNLAKNMTDLFI